MPSLATIVTVAFYALIFYNFARWSLDVRRHGDARRDAEDEHEHADDRLDDEPLDEHDSDTATLARSRAKVAATRQEMDAAIAARQVAFAASVIAEARRNRFIVAPALAGATALAAVVGGPLPGGCIAAVCALIALVPLAARSLLEGEAHNALVGSGLTDDADLYVPADWSRWPPL